MVSQFDAKISISPDVMIRQIAGESVLLDLKTERYFGLDDTSTRMLGALIEAKSVEAAYTVLAAEFDVAGDQLRRDMSDFIEELLQLGLVQTADPS